MMIDVNFSIISGKKQTLRLKAETTVEEAKQTLSFLVDSPPHTLTLLHKAQVLRETTKLGELDFSSRNFIAVGIRRKPLVMMKSKAFNDQQQVSPLKNIFGDSFDTVRQHFLENPSSVPILIAYIAHSDPMNARLLTENPQILLRFLGISPEEFLNAINNMSHRVLNTPNQQTDNNNENPISPINNNGENASTQPENIEQTQTQTNLNENLQNQTNFQVNTETIYSRGSGESENNNDNNNDNNNNNNNENNTHNNAENNNENSNNGFYSSIESKQPKEYKSNETEHKGKNEQNERNSSDNNDFTNSNSKNDNSNDQSSGEKKVATTAGEEADVDIAAFLDSMTPEDLLNLELILSTNVSLEEAIPVFLRLGKNVEATINELRRSH